MNTYARNGFMWNNIIILRPLAWPNLVNPNSSADMIVNIIKVRNHKLIL